MPYLMLFISMQRLPITVLVIVCGLLQKLRETWKLQNENKKLEFLLQ